MKVIDAEIKQEDVTLEKEILLPNSVEQTDYGLEIPVVVRNNKNKVTVSEPIFVSKTSNTIDVLLSFLCDVDYYGGVETNYNGNIESRLIKNPGTLTLTLNGLSPDTEYTIRAVALPVMGVETFSEEIVIRTEQ